MEIPRRIIPCAKTGVLALTFFITACDSGGTARTVGLTQTASTATNSVAINTGVTTPPSGEGTLGAQAIDGYIVGGRVWCDDVEYGRTGAGGWLFCPADTELISVQGGRDVGFDETATKGGEIFSGTLLAPGDARYVTPLTSVAAQIAHRDDVFNRNAYSSAIKLMGNRLGLPNLDLDKNPADDITLAKLNAQLNLYASQLTTNTDDYSTAIAAIAGIFESSVAVDLSDSAAMISAINQRVAPHLTQSAAAEVAVTQAISQELAALESSSTIGQIEATIEKIPPPPVAFALDINTPMVGLVDTYYYQNSWNYNGYYRTSKKYFSLAQFQSAESSSYGYDLSVDAYDTDKMVFNSDAFYIDKTLHDASIDVAIQFESLLDKRRLSVIVRDIKLSMQGGNSKSIEMNVPTGSKLIAQYVDNDGIITDVTEIAEEDLISSSNNGSFAVNLSEVRQQLSQHGYKNFLRQTGHYKTTIAIEGLRFELSEEGIRAQPPTYTISTANESLTGLGIQGFITLY